MIASIIKKIKVETLLQELSFSVVHQTYIMKSFVEIKKLYNQVKESDTGSDRIYMGIPITDEIRSDFGLWTDIRMDP